MLVYVIWTLTRRDVKALFEKNEAIVANPRPLMISVIVVTLLFNFAIYFQENERQQAEREFSENIYAYRIEVRVYDSETGERLSEIGWFEMTPTQQSSDQNRTISKSTQRLESDEEGPFVTLRGVKSEPFEMRFDAEGYEPQIITIDQNTDESIRIDLKPLPPSEETKEQTEESAN